MSSPVFLAHLPPHPLRLARVPSWAPPRSPCFGGSILIHARSPIVVGGLLLIPLLVILKHHANIARLIAGTESRFGSGRRQTHEPNRNSRSRGLWHRACYLPRPPGWHDSASGLTPHRLLSNSPILAKTYRTSRVSLSPPGWRSLPTCRRHSTPTSSSASPPRSISARPSLTSPPSSPEPDHRLRLQGHRRHHLPAHVAGHCLESRTTHSRPQRSLLRPGSRCRRTLGGHRRHHRDGPRARSPADFLLTRVSRLHQ